MAFMTWIVNRLNGASDLFYELYIDCYYAGWPLEILSDWFYYISDLFASLAWDFSDFGTWVNTVQAKVSEILTTWDIWTYFQWWFEAAENSWNWVWNATYHIWFEIEDWWWNTSLTVLDWISDVETWTQTQLNNLQSTFNTLITDVESWTTTQLNNIQATLTALITDLELWTTTQLNNLQATFNALIGNVESWTVTQIDNAKSAILAVIGDLETWTITEINTIQSILTTLIDWAALTTWITAWWNERLLDIQSLINGTLQAWFPFYDELVALWGDIKLFFTDPEDWLYKSADRIIERFW